MRRAVPLGNAAIMPTAEEDATLSKLGASQAGYYVDPLLPHFAGGGGSGGQPKGAIAFPGGVIGSGEAERISHGTVAPFQIVWGEGFGLGSVTATGLSAGIWRGFVPDPGALYPALRGRVSV